MKPEELVENTLYVVNPAIYKHLSEFKQSLIKMQIYLFKGDKKDKKYLFHIFADENELIKCIEAITEEKSPNIPVWDDNSYLEEYLCEEEISNLVEM